MDGFESHPNWRTSLDVTERLARSLCSNGVSSYPSQDRICKNISPKRPESFFLYRLVAPRTTRRDLQPPRQISLDAFIFCTIAFSVAAICINYSGWGPCSVGLWTYWHFSPNGHHSSRHVINGSTRTWLWTNFI